MKIIEIFMNHDIERILCVGKESMGSLFSLMAFGRKRGLFLKPS